MNLLESGANREIKNSDGLRPVDLGRFNSTKLLFTPFPPVPRGKNLVSEEDTEQLPTELVSNELIQEKTPVVSYPTDTPKIIEDLESCVPPKEMSQLKTRSVDGLLFILATWVLLAIILSFGLDKLWISHVLKTPNILLLCLPIGLGLIYFRYFSQIGTPPKHQNSNHEEYSGRILDVDR